MHILEVRMSHIVVGVLSCPAIASVLCLILSMTYHADISTRTNCRPRIENSYPSLSTVMTELTPERYIWRWFIALHTVPRLVLAVMYCNRLKERLPSGSGINMMSKILHLLCPVMTVLHWLENLAILGVSYVTMKESAYFHESMYKLFVSSSLAYMFTLCLLTKVTSRGYQFTSMERKANRFKYFSAIANLLFFLGGYYFHNRHEKYCEPFMHSYFAMCEYGLVLTNMIFHFTAYWDFYDQSLYAVPGDDDKFN